MKFIERMFGVVNYKRMDETLNHMIADGENERNTIRKEILASISILNPKTDGEEIQRLLLDMNSRISNSYDKEGYLRSFADRLK
jgi:hypothetical protein